MLNRLQQPLSLPRLSLPTFGSGSRRAHRDLVGLDIEPGQIVAAQVTVNGKILVEHAAGIPVPAEVVRDGEVRDVPALTEALRELFEQHKFDRRVRIGLANQRIAVRRLELPPIDDPKELATAVRFQAQDEIPMPIDSVAMDFHSLGIVNTPNGLRQQVIVVAARRDVVERVLQAARDAGLRPEAVDISAFAMIRALHSPQAPADERVLYLEIGGLTNLAVAEGRICHFVRVLGGGMEQIVGEVAERCAIPTAEARTLVRGVRLDQPEVPDADEQDTAHLARGVLLDGVRRIAADVRHSLDFHRSQDSAEPVSRAVLCGPALDVPGFETTLSQELGIPVSAGVVGQTPDADTNNVPPSRLTIAAGLAVEDVEA
jgi:type IV pilus assembly protein PilM